MTRYRAAPAGALVVAPLDQLTAIYHRPSGVTHLVDAPVPELLGVLGEEPADATALLARLASAYDVADADAAALADRLEEMVALGLARRERTIAPACTAGNDVPDRFDAD